MGQEIEADGFDAEDFSRFAIDLASETALLRQLHDAGRLSQRGPAIGLELEAWLLDRNFFPAPHNQTFLARLGDESVVPELSKYNIEINAPVEVLAGQGLGRMHAHLSATMRRCLANAHEDVDRVIAIGTLPNLRERDMSLEMITPTNRYRALNHRAMEMRQFQPIEIEIDCALGGGSNYSARFRDVMLESSTTSFQLHLQLPPQQCWRAYNASLMLAAPLLAISANSPFLFGRPLWHETRIAMFEQALAQPHDPQRVTLGSGYAAHDLVEMFEENRDAYPIMIPFDPGKPDCDFACLRMHNGTLWRWVRPLVGFDEDQTPHLRIEQRVLPAGPSVLDMMANAALYFGATLALAEDIESSMEALPFEAAQRNFYAAARYGLEASIDWPGYSGQSKVTRAIENMVDMAEQGLRGQGMAEELIDKYLSVISARLASGCNGASWQLAHYRRHGDLNRLIADYLEFQREGLPVHEWSL